MAGRTVDFLLEGVFLLPSAPDLARVHAILKRHGPDSTRPPDDPLLRILHAEYAFPEGDAEVYVFLNGRPDPLPPRWRPTPEGHAMRVGIVCHRVPLPRADLLAHAFRKALCEAANALKANAGYVDLGERQGEENPPAPWVTIGAKSPSRLQRMVGRQGSRLTMNRREPFPDGFVDGRAGFPPKRVEPIPACVLVAGALVENDDEATQQAARDAGLKVWTVPRLATTPRTVVGILAAELPMGRTSHDVEAEEIAQKLADAQERLARIAPGRPVGLVVALLPGGA